MVEIFRRHEAQSDCRRFQGGAFMLGLFAAPSVFHAVVPAEYITAPRIDATDMMVVIAGFSRQVGAMIVGATKVPASV